MGVREFVGVREDVLVPVLVSDAPADGVPVFEPVRDCVNEGVADIVGVPVIEGVIVFDGVTEGVLVFEGVTEGVLVLEGVTEGVLDFVGVTELVGVREVVGVRDDVPVRLEVLD